MQSILYMHSYPVNYMLDFVWRSNETGIRRSGPTGGRDRITR